MATVRDHAAPSAPGPDGRWDLGQIVRDLRAERTRWRSAHPRTGGLVGREFPSPEALQSIMTALRGALFPMRLGPTDLPLDSEDFYVGHALGLALNDLLEQVRLELGGAHAADPAARAQADELALQVLRRFASRLAAVRALLDEDVEAAFQNDPAAHGVDEVLLCYPGILAMIHHRLAHELYCAGAPMVARMISEIAHSQTGIDIHPGARIGPRCFIDHGTGVVIGETSVIGARARLYQAVTLGARSFEVGADGSLVKGQQRHPTLEDDVTIYAGATILGRITVGRGSVIGGNVWLTRSVPAGSQVTQAQSQQAA